MDTILQQSAGAAPAPAPGSGQSAAQFSGAMANAGVRPDMVKAAVQWFDSNTSFDIDAGRSAPFDLDGYEVRTSDRPALNALAVAIHEKGGTQQDFEAVVNWYRTHPNVAKRDVAMRKEAEAADLDDVRAAQRVLAPEWGHNWRANVTALNKYLDGMPAKIREKFESAVDSKTGIRLLNHPAALKVLLDRASGKNATQGSPGEPSARPKKGSSAVEREISEIEKLMRTNRTAYNRDEAKQKRLRELYAARG